MTDRVVDRNKYVDRMGAPIAPTRRDLGDTVQNSLFSKLRRSDEPLSLLLPRLLPSQNYMQDPNSQLLVRLVDDIPEKTLDTLVPVQDSISVKRFALVVALAVSARHYSSPTPFKTIINNRTKFCEETGLSGYAINDFLELTRSTSGIPLMEKLLRRVDSQNYLEGWVASHAEEFVGKSLPQIRRMLQQALPKIATDITSRRVRATLEIQQIPFERADFAKRRRFIEEFYRPDEVINYEQIGRALEINPETIRRWYKLASHGRLALNPGEIDDRTNFEMRKNIEAAIAILQQEGYDWRHDRVKRRINSKLIAGKLQLLGVTMTPDQVAEYLSNKRKTSHPIGERMRPLTVVIPEVNRLMEQGILDPEEIITTLRRQYQQDFTRATESKIRAHVLRPRIVAYIEGVLAERGTIPSVHEVKDYLGLNSTKIPKRVYGELGYPTE